MMRKLPSISFPMAIFFLALLVAAGCAPTRGNDIVLPVDQNPIQAALLQTTLTPPTPTPTISPTPIPTVTTTPTATQTPTSAPTAAPTFTPTSSIDEQAVKLAKEVAPQFSQVFGAQFDPSLAKGLDAGRIGGQAGQLAGMIAPVVDGNQKYTDRENLVREVEGIFSLNDSRLTLESMVIVNKATIQYPLLPLGVYMLACDSVRPNDCLAVSLQREEFQINPGSVSITPIGDVSTPTVDYQEGSIRKCFRIRRHEICIRVFR